MVFFMPWFVAVALIDMFQTPLLLELSLAFTDNQVKLMLPGGNKQTHLSLGPS